MDCSGFVLGDVVQLKYLECVFERIVEIIIPLGIIVLFILIIISGFNFMTAGDDPNKAAAAKKTFGAIIAGFLLLVMALLILRFIEALTGVNVTNFRITF